MIIKDQHNPILMPGQTMRSAAFSYQNGELGKESSAKEVVSEHTISVFVNDRLALNLVCTPSDLPELVIGRLLTEQIVLDVQEIHELFICENAVRARVFLKDSKKQLMPFIEQSPTCCSDNHVYLTAGVQTEVLPLPEIKWNPDQIIKIAQKISTGSSIYRKTHGTHGGFLIHKGEVVYECEDIGRHNAIDKAIGYLAMHGFDPDECMIYSTGRASADMVRKVSRARIPFFLAKAAPTGAAIDIANRFGLTLICNLRSDQFELYSPIDTSVKIVHNI